MSAEDKLALLLKEDTPPVRKSPRKQNSPEPSCSKKLKLNSPSKSLAKVPLLSPQKKRGIHLVRSKAKKEEMASEQILKVVGAIESQLAQPMSQATDNLSPELLLGQEVGKTLEMINDLRQKFRFKARIREILGDMEEAIALASVPNPSD
jgi:hypothetical protein